MLRAAASRNSPTSPDGRRLGRDSAEYGHVVKFYEGVVLAQLVDLLIAGRSVLPTRVTNHIQRLNTRNREMWEVAIKMGGTSMRPGSTLMVRWSLPESSVSAVSIHLS